MCVCVFLNRNFTVCFVMFIMVAWLEKQISEPSFNVAEKLLSELVILRYDLLGG